MRTISYVMTAALGLSAGLLLGPVRQGTQEPTDKLSSLTLKNMLQSMGYDAKMVSSPEGKSRFEIVVKTKKHELPINVEVSSNTQYVWIYSNLGDNKPSKKHEELLKETYKIEPTFFYISTNNYLMAALPMDNRGITSPAIQRNIDKFVADIDSSSKVWGD